MIFRSNENAQKGATMIEYMLMISLVSLFVLATLAQLGPRVAEPITETCVAMDTAGGTVGTK